MVMKNSIKPIILCLSAGGESVAKTLAKSHGFAIHGRSGRVKTADVFFDNTLEHNRQFILCGHAYHRALRGWDSYPCGCPAPA